MDTISGLPPSICESAVWKKIRFSREEATSNVDGVVADFVGELVALTGIGPERATAMVERALARTELNLPEDRSDGIGACLDWASELEVRITELLAIHLTQPLRIPHMTRRMELVERLFGDALKGMRVIDYGGGGGKDAIFYAESGASVTYCDLLDALTPHVQRRFELRRLGIEIVDVRDLGDERVDLINCMDVIEHVYDVENVVADIFSRLRVGGVLVCWPAFTPDWSGDHLEKNTAYKEYFVRLVESAGARLVARGDSILVFERCRVLNGIARDEREVIRAELYRRSRRYALVRALLAILVLPIYLLVAIIPFIGRGSRTEIIDAGVGRIADNVSVWRICNRRIASQATVSIGAAGYYFRLAHELAWFEGRRYKAKRFFELRNR